MNSVIEDTREIEGIESTNCPWTVRVGHDAVTSIVPYREPGEMGYITWFAVFQGDFLWQRIDSKGLCVQYKGGWDRADKDIFNE